MIRYNLRCKNGHDFDGWFRSSEGFGQAQSAGQIACTFCGDTQVEKALMAPSVDTKRAPEKPPLEKLRDYVEKNSDYVGDRFVTEARAMHEGRTDPRPIHGEARPDEARQMLEDGIPVAPLPFVPRAKQN